MGVPMGSDLENRDPNEINDHLKVCKISNMQKIFNLRADVITVTVLFLSFFFNLFK